MLGTLCGDKRVWPFYPEPHSYPLNIPHPLLKKPMVKEIIEKKDVGLEID